MQYIRFTKNKNYVYYGLVLVLAIILGIGPGVFKGSEKVHAISSAFDPNQLISDAVFTAKDSMTVSDIQSFLSAKGSVLASISTSLLGDGAAGRSAAQIIWDASHVSRTDFASSDGYGPTNALVLSLNPEVILVTLQKEQSLITANYDPTSSSTVTALNTAMGMGCPDGAGCSSAYAGFTNQVTYAAAQFMKNYYKASTSAYQPGQAYALINTTGAPYNAAPSQSVTINNSATSSLYQYTPHVFNGNYNFWYYLNLWFSSIRYQPSLGVGSDGSVYILDSGVRYPLTASGFAHWGFQSSQVHSLTSDELAYSVGSLVTSLALDNDQSVYYIDNGFKRAFTSLRILNKGGFNVDEISAVPHSILAKLPVGLPMYELVFATTGDGTVYIATNGTLYPVSYDMFYNAWAFDSPEIGKVPGSTLQSIPVGPLLTRLALQVGGDGTVYLIDRGKFYGMSGAVAKAWNFDLSQTRPLGPSIINDRQNAGVLTNLIKEAGGDGTVYLVQGGKKLPLSRTAWLSRHYSDGDVRTISSSLSATLPAGPVQR